MAESALSTPVLEPFLAFLEAPDASASHPTPLRAAAALGLGVAGAAAFAATVGAALYDPTRVEIGGGEVATAVPAFLLALPLAQLLCFPPLFLMGILRGKAISPIRLATVVAAGPGAAGAWLGSVVPVFLLYTLSGPDAEGRHGLGAFAIGLLAVATGLLAVWTGARNLLRARRAADLGAPGPMALLAHYVVAGWTTIILFLHLNA